MRVLRLTFALVVLFQPFAAICQLRAGSIVVGGDGMIDGKTQSSVKRKVFDLGANVGYVVAKNFLVGAGVDFTSDNQKVGNGIVIIGQPVIIPSVAEVTYRVFTPSVFARKYFLSKKLLPFVQTEVGRMSYFTKQIYADPTKQPFENVQYSFIVTPSAGASYFFNEHIALDSQVYYSNQGGSFGFRLGFSLIFGPKTKFSLGSD